MWTNPQEIEDLFTKQNLNGKLYFCTVLNLRGERNYEPKYVTLHFCMLYDLSYLGLIRFWAQEIQHLLIRNLEKFCEPNYVAPLHTSIKTFLANQDFQQNLNIFISTSGNDRLVAESRFEARKYHGHCQSHFVPLRNNLKEHSKLRLNNDINE